jgi:hypothetical protein
MKTFSKFELAAIKRNAATIGRFITKRNKLIETFNQLGAEIEDLNTQIRALDTGTRVITQGFGVEEIMDRVDGKWVFKYSDTITPPEVPAGVDFDIDQTRVLDDQAKVEEVETLPNEAPFNTTNY